MRATILAPRSWPSRPGLVTRMRAGTASDHHRLAVGTPHALQRADDLADRAVRLDGLDEERHQVRRSLRRRLKLRQAPHDLAPVAAALDLGQAGELTLLPLLVQPVDGDV